ncbi:MAG TPA: hypothetical protein VGW33_09705 [Terriglobia bacterium]|nr:hypothetical protein [Terriglobia bacterium]
MTRSSHAFLCVASGLATLLALPSWARGVVAHESGAHNSGAQESGRITGAVNILEGRLLASGAAPVLNTGSREVRLGSTSLYLLHTLADPRLAKRDVRLQGVMAADGTFQAEHLWTVKDGKLYKVRYYCHVCNIAAIEPGPCVCCQRPTELEEIPVDEVTPDTLVVP